MADQLDRVLIDPHGYLFCAILSGTKSGGASVRVGATASHRQARELLQTLRRDRVVLSAMDAPTLTIGRRATDAIKTHIEDQLKADGWASPVEVSTDADLTLNLIKDKVVVQVQLGNITRAFYDLMKMQAMHQQDRAVCAVLVVPMAEAARKMGSNLAQYERVTKELQAVFFHQITIPVLVVGVE